MEDIYFDSQRGDKAEELTQKKVSDSKFREFFKNPKKRLMLWIILGVVLIAAAGVGYYFYMKNTDKVAVDKSKKEAPKLYSAPLDGVMTTDVDATTRHPLGVIIENHTDARPQSGLISASIVYEAIAEGGITRFLAIYGTKLSEKVGPIRSARTYFVDWAHGYDAYLAHVGGNIDALDKIKAESILDLDQFRYPSAYWREKGLNVSSEHTMFASIPKLYDQAATDKYATSNDFAVFQFKDDPKPESPEYAAIPDSQTISIDYGNANYNVVFTYDKSTNSYKRSLAGTPHLDRETKEQISPKNVVVMIVDRKAIKTRINESGYEMTTVGEGVAKIFIDGKTIEGKWKKTAKDQREKFYDSTGAEIVFNRGQFWISVISPELKVTVE